MSDVYIPLADLSTPGSPFHAGELAVQARAGVADFANSVGRRSIRTEMPEQHQQFFAERPFMVLRDKLDRRRVTGVDEEMRREPAL